MVPWRHVAKAAQASLLQMPVRHRRLGVLALCGLLAGASTVVMLVWSIDLQHALDRSIAESVPARDLALNVIDAEGAHALLVELARQSGRSGARVKRCAPGAPSGFDEKVAWRMEHDRRPVLAALNHKLTVRQWAELHNVSSAPLVFSTASCESIPDDLSGWGPDFAFKAAHRSGCNIIVRAGRVVVHKPCGFLEGSTEGQVASGAVLRPHCATWLRYASVLMY